MFVKFGTIDFLPLTDKNNIYVNIRYNKDVNLQQNRELTNKIYNFVKNFFKDKYPNIVENIQVQIGTKTVFQPLQNFFFFNSFNPELATLNIKLIDSQLRDDKNNAVYIYQTLNKSLQNCIQQNT
jgi:multidrug efflux pump subunit AcrB